MKTLNQLIRLSKHRLLERQRVLNVLEAEAHRLEDEVQSLEAESLIEEAKAEQVEFGSINWAPYFERIKARRAELSQIRESVMQDVNVAREELHTAFAEMKKIEILRDQKAAEIAAAVLKAEQDALDEVGISMHVRGGS